MRDFSLEKYAELCQAINKNGYRAVSYSEYLANKNAENIIVLRHDIDRMPLNALAMAKVENKHGIKSTYYFRIPGTFKPEIIKEIANLGHEIGYHYESMDQANGDHKKAIENFKQNLAKLRKIYPVETVCMHGNPLTKYDNRDLWRHYDFKDCGIKGESYLSMGPDVAYFSDTGRTWSNKFKGKDHPIHADGRFDHIFPETTDDVIKLINDKKIDKFCLTVHSERWSATYLGWFGYYGLDLIVQMAKTLLRV